MSLLARLEKQKQTTSGGEEHKETQVARAASTRQPAQPEPDQHKELKAKIHERLVAEVDSSQLRSTDDAVIEQLREKVTELGNKVIEELESQMLRAERQKVLAEICDDVCGFGPIQVLLNDPSISEVMVNGPQHVYCERKGKLILTDVQFRDNAHVMHVIERIVSPLGRRCDESSPMVDARLPDGSRVNAIIPPLALDGPTITIRKFSKTPLTVQDLIRFGSLNEQMAEFLQACVKVRLNIVISGGTGSGKTTLLNVISSFIPDDERIITVEDAAELQLNQEHVVRLEARPANIEGKGAITIRELVKNCLRMRPERIVVGEVRGGEALDMLQAMNTGHDGSLTTGHANSPRDMISRLETMVLMAGMELPVRAIREQIASAVDVIVQASRLKDGSRKVTYITEVQGMEGDTIVLQDIFVFEQEGIDRETGKLIGHLKPTGIRPKFFEKFESAGIDIPPDIFIPKHH